jgi:hypothetical protein
MRETEESMTRMGAGPLRSATVLAGDRMVTMVKRGEIFVSATHSRPRLGARQLSLVQRVAEEVAWLLSRRACLAPPRRPQDRGAEDS